MCDSADGPWHGHQWELPPLILHPFDQGLAPAALLGSIKLSLHRLGASGPDLEHDLEIDTLFMGRYAEFRMLCLVGKDVMRWIGQCLDFASRDPVLSPVGIAPQSFAALLVNQTPAAVRAKFENWRVSGYRQILARSVGVASVFPEPPECTVLSRRFLENYYSFVDHLFLCFMSLAAPRALPPAHFHFSLYTSDEYMNALGCGLDNQALGS